METNKRVILAFHGVNKKRKRGFVGDISIYANTAKSISDSNPNRGNIAYSSAISNLAQFKNNEEGEQEWAYGTS